MIRFAGDSDRRTTGKGFHACVQQLCRTPKEFSTICTGVVQFRQGHKPGRELRTNVVPSSPRGIPIPSRTSPCFESMIATSHEKQVKTAELLN